LGRRDGRRYYYDGADWKTERDNIEDARLAFESAIRSDEYWRVELVKFTDGKDIIDSEWETEEENVYWKVRVYWGKEKEEEGITKGIVGGGDEEDPEWKDEWDNIEEARLAFKGVIRRDVYWRVELVKFTDGKNI
jgi:hypothetical protein